MQIAPHLKTLQPSATLHINQKIKELRAQGRTISHFGFGQAPFFVHPLIEKALVNAAHEKGYLPSQGLPELREAVAAFYRHYLHLDITGEQVVIGPGSKELIFALITVLDGTLFLPAPRWVSYEPQAKLAGRPFINIPTRFQNAYKITAEDLRAALEKCADDEQKILLLNSPCNPTGQVYGRAELEALVQVARAHQVVIISDEIYGLVSFGDEPFVSLGQLYPEGTIVTGGLSKDRSLGGYRIGVALFPKSAQTLLERVVTMATETFSCVASPIQYAACTAYEINPELETYIQTCTQIHKLVLHYAYQQLKQAGIRCLAPAGGFYLMPDFSPFKEPLNQRGIVSDTALVDDLLKKSGVAVLAGSHFGMEPAGLSFRLSPVDYDGEKAYKGYTPAAIQDPARFVQHYCPQVVVGCRALTDYVKTLAT